MRARFYAVRTVELGITIVTSILAIQSFFSSSLYEFTRIFIHDININFQIRSIPAAFDIEAALPIFITLLTIAITIYYGVFGASTKIINIYYFNLILILPELLSYSKLDWLMLFDLPNLFSPSRAQHYSFYSGLVVIAGYLFLLFISKSRESLNQIILRGAPQQTADNIYMYQAGAAVILITASFLITSVISTMTSIIGTRTYGFFKLLPYPYLILGIISSITIAGGLLIYFRKSTSNDI